MPIYEYRCEGCGVFEEMQRITDPPLTRCPRCKKKVQRLISQTSFQLKGSGWYVTDYARAGGGDAKKKGGSSDGTSDSAPDSKSESKSESKNESKSESKAESKSDAKTKTESKAESKSTSSGTTEKSAS
jgi:putative FmdB family regulatory protein